MQWLSSVAEAATSAVSTIQQTIEAEKNEFIEEYNTVRSDVPPSKTASGSTAGASSTEGGGTDSALQNLRRVGWAMLNPLEDQDSLKAEVVGPSVVMLPWEAPGLSEPVRVRMRALSQEPAVFLSPPQAEESFDFKMESSLSLVVEALSVDKHLEKQRHVLVPQQVGLGLGLGLGLGVWAYYWQAEARARAAAGKRRGAKSLPSRGRVLVDCGRGAVER